MDTAPTITNTKKEILDTYNELLKKKRNTMSNLWRKDH